MSKKILTALIFLTGVTTIYVKAQEPILTFGLHAYPTYVGLGYTQDDMNLEFEVLIGDPDEDDLAYGGKLGYRLNLMNDGAGNSLFIVPRVGYSFAEFYNDDTSFNREGVMYEAGVGFTAEGMGLSFSYGYDEVIEGEIYVFKFYWGVW